MPWAWFFPALTQISLLLPLILLTFKKLMPNRTLVRIVFSSLILGATACCFISTYYADVGALPFGIYPVSAQDPNQLNTVTFDYLNMVYMKPYFHLNTYIFGVVLALVYLRYLLELREDNRENSQMIEVSLSSRLFVFVSENTKIRYACYTIGLLMIAGAYIWLYPFYSNAPNQS